MVSRYVTRYVTTELIYFDLTAYGFQLANQGFDHHPIWKNNVQGKEIPITHQIRKFKKRLLEIYQSQLHGVKRQKAISIYLKYGTCSSTTICGEKCFNNGFRLASSLLDKPYRLR